MTAILRIKHWQFFVFFFIIPGLMFIGIYIWFIYTMIDMTAGIPMNGGNPNNIQDMLAFQQEMMRKMAFIYIPTLIPFFATHVWMWSVAKQSKEWVEESLQLNNILFKITLVVPILYTLTYTIGMFFFMQNFMAEFINFGPNNGMANFFAIWAFAMLGGIFTFACTMHNFYFVARSYKTAELQRKTTFGDYVGEFFMTWFPFVGIWIMQPKLNKWLNTPPDEEDDFIDLITD